MNIVTTLEFAINIKDGKSMPPLRERKLGTTRISVMFAPLFSRQSSLLTLKFPNGF
jgi:hypothetical protein